jgi:hypothetical protein
MFMVFSDPRSWQDGELKKITDSGPYVFAMSSLRLSKVS